MKLGKTVLNMMTRYEFGPYWPIRMHILLEIRKQTHISKALSKCTSNRNTFRR